MHKNKNLSSVLEGSESFVIAEEFINTEKSILYIARDDREIYNIKEKLKWFLPKVEILIYRSWNQIPYDNVSPSKEIQSERIRTLYQLSKKNKTIILTSVNAIIQKTINKKILSNNFIEIHVNKKINFNSFIRKLSSLGYQRVSVVRDKTEFAIRGSIIDVFIVGHEKSIRIDFFDDKIESIYTFDNITQKRLDKFEGNSFFIYTSSELLLNEESINLFRKNFRECFPNYRLSKIYHSFSDSIIPPGGEQFIPLFLEKMESLFSFIDNTKIILTPFFNNLLELRIENIDDFYNARKDLNENFYLEPSRLYLSKNQIISLLKNYELINLHEFNKENNINLSIKKISNLSSIKKEIDFKFIKNFFNIHEMSKKLLFAPNQLVPLRE